MTGLWALNVCIIASTVWLLPAGRCSGVVERISIFITGFLLLWAGNIAGGLVRAGTFSHGRRRVLSAHVRRAAVHSPRRRPQGARGRSLDLAAVRTPAAPAAPLGGVILLLEPPE